MVIALVNPAIKIVKLAWRYRKQIYSVVSAQDRYIKGAFVGTRVSKAAQYGWRSGAAIGGLVGSLNTNYAPDTPGNGVQTIQPVNTSRTPHKTSSRYTGRKRTKREYCKPTRRYS